MKTIQGKLINLSICINGKNGSFQKLENDIIFNGETEKTRVHRYRLIGAKNNAPYSINMRLPEGSNEFYQLGVIVDGLNIQTKNEFFYSSESPLVKMATETSWFKKCYNIGINPEDSTDNGVDMDAWYYGYKHAKKLVFSSQKDHSANKYTGYICIALFEQTKAPVSRSLSTIEGEEVDRTEITSLKMYVDFTASEIFVIKYSDE